jgi:hypothetical protein
MKIDRTKLVIDGVALLLAVLVALSIGAFAPLYAFTPGELALAGVAACFVARILMVYVASQPNGVGYSDLTSILAPLAKTQELGQVLNLLSASQQSQFKAVQDKLNSMVHPIVLDPAAMSAAPVETSEPVQSAPESMPAEAAPSPAAPATGPPAPAVNQAPA